MEPKETKPKKKSTPKSITLKEVARVECQHNGRSYPVTLGRRTWTIVEEMDLEVDPYTNRIRADKFKSISDQLKF